MRHNLRKYSIYRKKTILTKKIIPLDKKQACFIVKNHYLRRIFAKRNYLQMIKNIIFDFGGVLTLLTPDEAIKRFKALGVENPEEYLNPYCQQGAFFKLENGDISEEQFCIELGELCHRNISYEDAKHAWMGFISSVHEDILDYLQLFRSRYTLGILSNTNPFIQSWAGTANFTSKGKALGDYFDHLFFSYRMGASKPSEKIYKRMLLEGNLKAEETLFIDDSDKNIEAARKLGISTLKVENGEDWRNKLDKVLLADR